MASPVSPVRRRIETAEIKRPPPALTDDLLEEIFLRVGSPADLARASAACVSFRRLITDPSFLRRYRSIHRPLLLGFLTTEGLLRAKPPYPSSPASRAFYRAADFSFNDYLPDGPSGTGIWWYPSDVRDGRVLLRHIPADDEDEHHTFFPDLAVCDPLSRRYMLLPPMPEDLVAYVQVLGPLEFAESLLVPSRHEDLETSFSVIWWTCCVTRLVVFVYSSISDHWSVASSPIWNSLGLNLLQPPLIYVYNRPQCAYGSLYWKLHEMNKFLKLDMNTMEFSIIDIPPVPNEWDFIIVEAGEGKLAMICQIDESASMDYYTFSQDGNKRTNGWHMKKTISLPYCYRNYDNYIIGSAEGYIFLQCTPENQDVEPTAYLSAEIETFNVERVCEMQSPTILHALPYLGFPPSMSPGRIQ